MSSSTTVLGLGNQMMGDDGAGLVALEHLQALQFDPPIGFVDGGTWGLTLLPDIENADALLICDAVHADAEPGAVLALDRTEIPRFLSTKLSPHQVDVRELLALAEVRGNLPEKLALVGVQVEATEFATGLSDAVNSALPLLIESVLDILKQWGHIVVTDMTPGDANMQ